MAMVKGALDYLKTLPGKVADAIVVPLLVVAVVAVALFLVAVATHRHVPVWALVAALVVGFIAGGLVTRGSGGPPTEMVPALSPYDTYVEHVRDALGDLRKAILGELPGFSVRDFVEIGIFQPAHILLTREAERGEVRFSILHVEGDEFVMTNADGPFPALGHRPESRQNFRLPVTGSFSQLAYERNRIFSSGKLSDDDRFEAHEAAEAGRSYESIVSVPLRTLSGEVDGVMNVIATGTDAFSAVDRTYVSLLGSVVDVARAQAMKQ